MSRQTQQRNEIARLAIVILLLFVFATVGLREITIDRTSTPRVITAEDALTESLTLLPDSIEISRWFVNEATVTELAEQWYLTPKIMDWPDTAKVWIVAFETGITTRDEILSPPPFDGFVSADSQGYDSPVAHGAYFIWRQDTGSLTGRGALDSPTGTNVTTWTTLRRLISIGEKVNSSPEISEPGS